MEPSASKSPRVFISYSHDSREHEDRVLNLANRLRTDGVDALIDQYGLKPPDGWAVWTMSQIRDADFVLMVCTDTYRRRAEGGEEPGRGRGVLWEARLIYNDLYRTDAKVQKYIPVLFSDGVADDIPAPLQTLAHYAPDTETGYDDLYRHLTGRPLHPMPPLGELRSLPTKDPESYPASLAAKARSGKSESLEARHRERLIKQVRIDWIDGVLDQSLYRLARIELGLVERPLNTIVRVPSDSSRHLPPGSAIGRVFDEAGAVLILGFPGTGKTTLLLELARGLLITAVQNETQPIPVVFNLSSWAVRHKPLRQWLISELNDRNDVPKKLATAWIEREEILPLLDGLDEVAAEHREACVEAINEFRRDYGLLPIAVCSRIAEYEALGTRLRMRSAVEVQPLTRSQVEDCLDRAQGPVQALRAAARNDPSFWNLLETPLMLWMAILAYRDAPAGTRLGESSDWRDALFRQFTEAMFHRRADAGPYSSDQVMRWLSSLARVLAKTNQTVVYLENLNFDWLPAAAMRGLARAGVVAVTTVIGGLIGSFIVGIVFGLLDRLISGLIDGLVLGLLAGLIAGLTAAAFGVRPAELGVFRWTRAATREGEILRASLLSFVVAAPTLGLMSGILVGLVHGAAAKGIYAGLTVTSLVAFVIAITSLAAAEAVPETRSIVNQGTRRSLSMAFRFFLGTGLFTAVIVGQFVGWTAGWTSGLIVGLSYGVISGFVAGLISGLIGALSAGGIFVLKHFMLRLFIRLAGLGPLNYPAFLAQAKELMFLRRVGGGYIFVHRLLQDYFASLPD